MIDNVVTAIYSDGPIGSPYLFDLGDAAKFLRGPDGDDVPRNQSQRARRKDHVRPSPPRAPTLDLHRVRAEIADQSDHVA